MAVFLFRGLRKESENQTRLNLTELTDGIREGLDPPAEQPEFKTRLWGNQRILENQGSRGADGVGKTGENKEARLQIVGPKKKDLLTERSTEGENPQSTYMQMCSFEHK